MLEVDGVGYLHIQDQSLVGDRESLLSLILLVVYVPYVSLVDVVG